MGRRGIFARTAGAVALLAIALFSLAAVRSVDMQAAMAGSGGAMPMCGAMAQGPAPSHDAAPHGKGAVVCAYCAAAGHAAVSTPTVAVLATSTIAWASYAVLRPLGPRGPPSITAKSRGPPPPTLTV